MDPKVLFLLEYKSIFYFCTLNKEHYRVKYTLIILYTNNQVKYNCGVIKTG